MVFIVSCPPQDLLLYNPLQLILNPSLLLVVFIAALVALAVTVVGVQLCHRRRRRR